MHRAICLGMMVLRSAMVLGLVGILAAGGCGKKGLATYPVQGAVQVDGRPAAGVMVIFCPVNGSDAVKKLRPFGFTGADGKFLLTTDEKGDGAPAGEYKVLLQWTSTSNDSRDGGIVVGPDRLQGRYMNLEKCQFSVDVKEEANNVPPFNLKSK